LTDSISKKDKKDWENFLSSNEKLPNKDSKPKQHSSIKTKSIDLHGYTLDEANKVISDFIKNCYDKKVNKIIVVTGKGLHSDNEKNPYVSKNLSILKYSIPEYISNNKSLMNIINEIKDAKIDDGGDGAFYILLKKNLKIT
jgi:DNA-nicking Smr family endonuclease|tara:strand:+ start:199 stop:621 length:423 start_codon:yes stop_codon:yes gene_type:complete